MALNPTSPPPYPPHISTPYVPSPPLSLQVCSSIGRPLFSLFHHPSPLVADGATLLMAAIAGAGAAAAEPLREAALAEGAVLTHLHRALFMAPPATAGGTGAGAGQQAQLSRQVSGVREAALAEGAMLNGLGAWNLTSPISPLLPPHTHSWSPAGATSTPPPSPSCGQVGHLNPKPSLPPPPHAACLLLVRRAPRRPCPPAARLGI